MGMTIGTSRGDTVAYTCIYMWYGCTCMCLWWYIHGGGRVHLRARKREVVVEYMRMFPRCSVLSAPGSVLTLLTPHTPHSLHSSLLTLLTPLSSHSPLTPPSSHSSHSSHSSILTHHLTPHSSLTPHHLPCAPLPTLARPTASPPDLSHSFREQHGSTFRK